MNNQTKVVLAAIGALLAMSLVLRFVLLSRAGVPGPWIFYLGLPIGAVVALLLLLLRIGVLNFGEKPSAAVQHARVLQPAPLTKSAPASQRLQELEDLRTSGAITDTEYAAKRARIISGI